MKCKKRRQTQRVSSETNEHQFKNRFLILIFWNDLHSRIKQEDIGCHGYDQLSSLGMGFLRARAFRGTSIGWLWVPLTSVNHWTPSTKSVHTFARHFKLPWKEKKKMGEMSEQFLICQCKSQEIQTFFEHFQMICVSEKLFFTYA